MYFGCGNFICGKQHSVPRTKASRLLGPSNPVRIRTQCPQNHHNSLALSLRAVTTKQEHQKQQQLLQSQQQQQQQQGKEEWDKCVTETMMHFFISKPTAFEWTLKNEFLWSNENKIFYEGVLERRIYTQFTSIQCDQIWQNFATWAKFRHLGKILKVFGHFGYGLFCIWQTIITYYDNFICYGHTASI